MIVSCLNRNSGHFLLVLIVCTTIVTCSANCYWTWCQPNVGPVKGCEDFNATEKAREVCDDGFRYQCCATNEPTEEFPADQCWWSECRPNKDRANSGCPSHSVLGGTRACAEGGGNQYQCCMKKSALLVKYNDFKITGGLKKIAEYLHATSKTRHAPYSGHRNTGHEQKLAGENESNKEPTGHSVKYVISAKRTSSKPREDRNMHLSNKRQIPIFVDYWDSVGDGPTDYTDDSDVESLEDGEQLTENVRVSGGDCDGDRRLIGYYTSWSPNEMSGGILEKLTHVVFSFLITQADGTVDFDSSASQERLQRLMALRSSYPQVKIMFAVGGGTNSQHFSTITASSETRGTFVASIVRLTGDNGFDGVDIDWEFPVVTTGALRGTPDDKANYVLLMKELREALDAHAAETGRTDPYLISFAGPAGQWALDPGFDLPSLLQYVDFVNVMAYDYFGVWGSSKWSSFTGPPAPLYPGIPSDFPEDFSRSNVDWTVGYYIEKTNSPEKINMGVPFYGWYWNNVGDPINAADPMWRTAQPVDGVYQGGATPWRRIQEDHLSDSRFQQMFHEMTKTPYAWNEETKVFLGYEDQNSLGFKVNYATEKNVGGLMIWAVDMDDDDLTLLNTLPKVTLCEKSNHNNVY